MRPGATACPYCGVAFDVAAGTSFGSQAAAPEVPLDLPAIPVDWVEHADPWVGFSLSRPPVYRVECLRGVIRISENASGTLAAWILPRTLPAPAPLRQVAGDFVRWKRSAEPAFTAWLVPDDDAQRLSLRTRSQLGGVTLEGSFVVMTDGSHALITGFHAPASQAADRARILTLLLSTLGEVKPMARQMFRDPIENGFQYALPQGWSGSGGTERNFQGGVVRKFVARKDALGLVQAGMPGLTWVFADGPMAMWRGMGGLPAMPFMPAAEFAARWYGPQAQRGQAGLGVISVQDRADLLSYLAARLTEEGTPPEGFDLSVAEVVTTYPEGGVGLRQRTRLAVARPRMPMGPRGGGWWMASPDFVRAPEAEFDTWEPVLAGILDSRQINAAWQQLLAGYGQAMPMPGPDLLAQALGQLIPGGTRAPAPAPSLQSPLPDSGLNVPAGFDVYWRDALDRLYGGRWPTEPGPAWERLEAGA